MDDTVDNGKPESNRKLLLQACRLDRSVRGHRLLNDVSLDIDGGDRVAIVGPTGSGKTVLLRALAMLDPLDTGSVLWHGRSVCGNDVPLFRSRVTYLHQRPALVEGTVEENLKSPLLLRVHRGVGFDVDGIRSRLAALGRDESFLAKRTHDLSGGEAQLTALLRVMQLDPEVLLLDEPTSALDGEATQMVEQLIGTWLSEKPDRRAFVWVTHIRDQAERIADRVLAMSHGSLAEVP